MLEDQTTDTLTFTQSTSTESGSSYVNKTLENAETYTEIVQEFVYFLNAIGYSYIGGLTVLDQDGKELHTTDF